MPHLYNYNQLYHLKLIIFKLNDIQIKRHNIKIKTFNSKTYKKKEINFYPFQQLETQKLQLGIHKEEK